MIREVKIAAVIMLSFVAFVIFILVTLISRPNPENICKQQYGQDTKYNNISGACILPNGDLKGIR